VVTPDGRIRTTLEGPDGRPVRGEGAGVLEAPMGHAETLYGRCGDGLGAGLYLGATGLLGVWTHRGRLRLRRAAASPPLWESTLAERGVAVKA
jgi:hypothetical protein